MLIIDIDSFLGYFEGTRRRTLNVAELIPEDKIDWAPKEGKYTFGEIIRHVASAERYIYVLGAIAGTWDYPGHGRELGADLRGALSYLRKMHSESLDLLSNLGYSDLQQDWHTPTGKVVKAWQFLRAMCEHEIYHSGELDFNLSLLGIATPPLFGISLEQLIASNRVNRHGSKKNDPHRRKLM
ncbi:DinB family protein [candidate division KSB1 bacterium]|nr:DinB family protein [candidate division KSB1 bacterium]NIR69352.1 DinB family protein [candidate division KSB1 bacterium]NIS24170.1 DinB family protein [candidate division KSB1 bacterium]NIT71085.1 DinB family protein [candidate division KSB1 bacterium]NIU24789.1 DinB family protein [candidate division KSB1 bacterium]